MEDRQVGRVFRSMRIRRGLRQRDVGERASVSEDVVSLLERGQLERLSFSTIRRLWSSLGVAAELDPRLSPADRTQLLEAGHASLVEQTVREYRPGQWEAIVEYTFNHFGERGSVDLLCWRAADRTLAVNEVKTRLPDIQDVHAGIDRKARILPTIVERERGWRPILVGRILIVADTRANRRVVGEHPETFETSFPARSREARAWLSVPDRPLSALWFMSYPNDARRYASRSRVRARNQA